MSTWVPPLNAVELWDFTRKHGLKSHKAAIELFEASAYEYVGSWASDGGEYYAPIAGRLPATDECKDAETMLIISPTSFGTFSLTSESTGADMRAFLDAEDAYLPLGGEG